MVGWVGPETLTGRLFEELPALRRIAAWDAEEQRYRAAWPHRSQDLPRLMPGMGLLLFIRADTPVEWTRPIGPDGALQRLHPGLNLVGWTGEDGTPAGEALDRLGDVVIAAWDWDASSGQYATYDLSASGADEHAAAPGRRVLDPAIGSGQLVATRHCGAADHLPRRCPGSASERAIRSEYEKRAEVLRRALRGRDERDSDLYRRR